MRYSEMLLGHRSSKIALLKAKEEAERYGRVDLQAECLVKLASQC